MAWRREIVLLIVVSLAALAQAQQCCTPAQWTSRAETVNSLGFSEHTIYYDSVRQWVRWDRSGNLETAGVNQRLITWTDYVKLIEYVYWPDLGTCDQYGPDAFYAWCYGVQKGYQTFAGPITIGNQAASLWKTVDEVQGPFHWVSANAGCLPLQTNHKGESSTFFYNTTVGAPPASTWALPAVCGAQQTLAKRAPSPIPSLRDFGFF